MDSAVLHCRQLKKTYLEGENQHTVLDKIDFDLEKGQKTAIVGASGSGKSTLLHILGGLDNASSGKTFVGDACLSELSTNQLATVRNENLGFVYQFHHLLPEFSALENIAMPLRIANVSKNAALAQASEVLNEVGLSHRESHRPSQLSGGERQRVAIARAIVNRPSVVLADEPTGNLDAKTGHQIYDLFLELQQKHQMAFLVVTHDLSLAALMDKCFSLENGHLFEN